MITVQTFRKLALAFDESEEQLHIGKISFLIKKKTFATLNEKQRRATLKLSENDQSIFSMYGDKTAVFPVPNKWGKHGWTHFLLNKLDDEFLNDALTVAYCEAAPQRLVAKYIQL
jgi:hypothetical protein